MNLDLINLEKEGFLQIIQQGKRGKCCYQITKDKEQRMLDYLQAKRN